MTPTAIAQTVAKLYTAAGRHYGKVELEVYAEALYDVDDDIGRQACRDVIRTVDLGARAPTPKDILDAARTIQQRVRLERAATRGLPADTGPLLPVEENRRRLREALELLHKR